MARRKTPQGSSYDALADLDRTVQWVVANHGVPGVRVEEILRRAVNLREKHGEGMLAALASSLLYALRILPTEKALNLFESEDPLKLVEWGGLPEYFSSDEVSLFTLQELAGLLRSFSRHMKSNRAVLVTTGFPRGRFSDSRWLDRLMWSLYPFRLPDSVQVIRDKVGDVIYEPSWQSGKDGDTCSEELAPSEKLLKLKDSSRIEALRPRVFELKIKVLEELVNALQLGDTENLWQACMTHFTDALPYETADFLFRRDAAFAPRERRARILFGIEPTSLIYEYRSLRGGLSSLFELIAHCEFELSVGAMDSTKRALITLAVKYGAANWREVLGTTYFEVLDKPWRDDLEKIFAEYWNRQVRLALSDAWEKHWQRVKESLGADLRVTVTISSAIKRKYSEPFRSHVQSLAEFGKSWLESKGELPTLAISGPSEVQGDDANTFVQESGFWTLTYKRETQRARHLLGMSYIAWLLAHPEEEIKASELVSRFRPSMPVETPGTVPNEESLMAEGLPISSENAMPERPDERALREYKRVLEGSPAEIERARLKGDSDRVAQLESKRDWLIKELGSGSPRRRHTKGTKDPDESHRLSVRFCIRKAIREILKVHPSLGEHLDSHVDTGKWCRYRVPIRWQT